MGNEAENLDTEDEVIESLEVEVEETEADDVEIEETQPQLHTQEHLDEVVSKRLKRESRKTEEAL